MKLEAVKAKHGDALILTGGGARVLIDGGERGVWRRFLKPRIAELDEDGVDPPEFDLMMVSHIDSDHIAGIIDLTQEIIEATGKPPATIHQAWVNTFSDAILKAEIESDRSASDGSAASVASAFTRLVLPDLEKGHTDVMLSSVRQGRTLQTNLETIPIPINKWFGGKLAMAGVANRWKAGDLTIEVIGPTQAEIDALRDAWKKELPKILAKEAAKAADLASAKASLDTSVYNLASIVAIARVGEHSILLTGDARGDMIERWLDASNMKGKQHFSILKLPHHGSDRNVTQAFFERVTADHYVICGDGNHGNPEPPVFEMIFAARGNADYKIHLTYSPDEIKAHKNFTDDKDKALDQILAKEPWRIGKLNYPAAGKKSFFVEL